MVSKQQRRFSLDILTINSDLVLRVDVAPRIKLVNYSRVLKYRPVKNIKGSGDASLSSLFQCSLVGRTLNAN